MTQAMIIMGGLGTLIGFALCFASSRFTGSRDPVAKKIDALLPQIQCGQCGYPGCWPYATAIANGQADINQCPPGGETTILALGQLLGRAAKPLDPAFGQPRGAVVAVIDERSCIGCARCLPVCPVDAILGAPRYMHTVLASECTGCELCVAPCPVDCISLQSLQ